MASKFYTDVNRISHVLKQRTQSGCSSLLNCSSKIAVTAWLVIMYDSKQNHFSTTFKPCQQSSVLLVPGGRGREQTCWAPGQSGGEAGSTLPEGAGLRAASADWKAAHPSPTFPGGPKSHLEHAARPSGGNVKGPKLQPHHSMVAGALLNCCAPGATVLFVLRAALPQLSIGWPVLMLWEELPRTQTLLLVSCFSSNSIKIIGGQDKEIPLCHRFRYF